VIYRLHPNEDLDSYPQENLPTNFSYSHKTPMFLELVAASEYLIGAFSTTLYEGLALGAKVLVLPLTGFENMNRAIAAGDVTVIKSIDAIREAVLSAKPAENADNYYAKENLND
jgi:spore coat polysaccharide biosynthesis predicted glycosyltransferase SpsG